MQVSLSVADVPVCAAACITYVRAHAPWKEAVPRAGTGTGPGGNIPGIERAEGHLGSCIRIGAVEQGAHIDRCPESPAAVDRSPHSPLHLHIFQETAQGGQIDPEYFLRLCIVQGDPVQIHLYARSF